VYTSDVYCGQERQRDRYDEQEGKRAEQEDNTRDAEYRMAPIVFGKAETLLKGDDVALLAYGNMVAPAYEAARLLAGEGIHAEFVNLRWAKPLDTDRNEKGDGRK